MTSYSVFSCSNMLGVALVRAGSIAGGAVSVRRMHAPWRVPVSFLVWTCVRRLLCVARLVKHPMMMMGVMRAIISQTMLWLQRLILRLWNFNVCLHSGTHACGRSLHQLAITMISWLHLKARRAQTANSRCKLRELFL
jgi:hypothetical protein